MTYHTNPRHCIFVPRCDWAWLPISCTHAPEEVGSYVAAWLLTRGWLLAAGFWLLTSRHSPFCTFATISWAVARADTPNPKELDDRLTRRAIEALPLTAHGAARCGAKGEQRAGAQQGIAGDRREQQGPKPQHPHARARPPTPALSLSSSNSTPLIRTTSSPPLPVFITCRPSSGSFFISWAPVFYPSFLFSLLRICTGKPCRAFVRRLRDYSQLDFCRGIQGDRSQGAPSFSGLSDPRR